VLSQLRVNGGLNGKDARVGIGIRMVLKGTVLELLVRAVGLDQKRFQLLRTDLCRIPHRTYYWQAGSRVSDHVDAAPF